MVVTSGCFHSLSGFSFLNRITCILGRSHEFLSDGRNYILQHRYKGSLSRANHCEVSLHRLGLLYLLLSRQMQYVAFCSSFEPTRKKAKCLITVQQTVFYFCLPITRYPVDLASTNI